MRAEDVPIVATDMSFKTGDLETDEQPVDVGPLINARTPTAVAGGLRAAAKEAAATMRRTAAAANNITRIRGRGAARRAAVAATSLFTLVYLTGTFGHRGLPA